MTLHLFIIFGLAFLFISSTKERFLIPDGYKGDVYVIYGVRDGETVNKTRWAVTYRIPKDGVLRVQEPMIRTWTRTGIRLSDGDRETRTHSQFLADYDYRTSEESN